MICLLLSAAAKFADLVDEKFPDLVNEKFADLVDESLKDPARITKSSHRDPHRRRQVTRVNSTNILDEGLRSGEEQRLEISGSRLVHDVPRFTSPRWRIATSC
jgi:hypothetical protein